MILLSDSDWEIKQTKTRGMGLFTKTVIKRGAVIGDYLGMVLRNKELTIDLDPSNFYLMYYNDRASIFPDLKKPGIHLINHACSPNVGIYPYQGHTLFFALHNISAGEELTTNYMLAPQDELCNPCLHICNCESKSCSGTMHLSEEIFKEWNEFKELKSKSSKQKRIKYNSLLPKLPSYPKKITDQAVYSFFDST